MRRAALITAAAFDVVLLCTASWLLVVLLVTGAVLVMVAAWAMHRYPEDMTP